MPIGALTYLTDQFFNLDSAVAKMQKVFGHYSHLILSFGIAFLYLAISKIAGYYVIPFI